MIGDHSASRGDAARDAAHAWLARLRGPHDAYDEAAFEDWYAADPAHAAAYDAVLDTWERADTAALRPSATDRAASPRAANRGWSGRRLAAAAAVVLAITGTLMVDQIATPGGSAQAATLASRVGEIRTVALADGSRVTLDTDTVIDVLYGPQERRLQLRRGRARFAVAPDADRPFRVLGGAAMIEARGTRFDVEIRGSALIVSLLSGKLAVRSGSDSDRTLVAGERLAVAPAAGRASLTPVSPAELRWPSGMLSFENAPLGEVVAAANRYAAAQVRLPEQAMRGLRFTGTVRARDQAGLARLLAATFDLSVAQAPSGDLLLHSARENGDGDGV